MGSAGGQSGRGENPRSISDSDLLPSFLEDEGRSDGAGLGPTVCPGKDSSAVLKSLYGIDSKANLSSLFLPD